MSDYSQNDLENAGARNASIEKFGRFVKDMPFFVEDITVYDPTTMHSENVAESTDRIVTALHAGESAVISSLFLEEPVVPDTMRTKFTRIAARNGQNSRHGVFFGKMSLLGTSVSIAAKTFPDNDGHIDRASVEELVKSHAVINSGMRTYEPLIIGRYDGTTYSISALEEDTSTYDSIMWADFAKDPPSNPGMIQKLRRTAILTATLHNRGWGHGDYYPRNIASDISGKVFAIDWETAQINGEVGDPEVQYARAINDLYSLVTSFYHTPEHSFNPGIGLLSGVSIDDSLKLLDTYFLAPYISERLKMCQSKSAERDVHQLINEVHEVPDMIGYEA